MKDFWNPKSGLSQIWDFLKTNDPSESFWNENLYDTPAAKETMKLADELWQQTDVAKADSRAKKWLQDKVADINSRFSSTSGYGSGAGAGSYSGSGTSAGSGSVLQQMQNDPYVKFIQDITNQNNAWAADQAQKQMDFQERMSSTAFQREVADMQAAGLNPVLSVTGGNGASTPTGAMAQPDNSNTRILGELALASVSALGNTAQGLAGKKSGWLDGMLPQLLSAGVKSFGRKLGLEAGKKTVSEISKLYNNISKYFW